MPSSSLPQRSLSAAIEDQTVSRLTSDPTFLRSRRLHYTACWAHPELVLGSRPLQPPSSRTSPCGPTAPLPHASLGSRLGMLHVWRSPRSVERPSPFLLCRFRQGPSPQRHPQHYLLRGRRVHFSLPRVGAIQVAPVPSSTMGWTPSFLFVVVVVPQTSGFPGACPVWPRPEVSKSLSCCAPPTSLRLAIAGRSFRRSRNP